VAPAPVEGLVVRSEGKQMVEHRRKRVQLDTDGFKITGTITLPPDEHHGRLSDMLNARERDFIALTDVEVEPQDGGPARRHQFTAVSRDRIVLASELD
jgi:hypothetical protein